MAFLCSSCDRSLSEAQRLCPHCGGVVIAAPDEDRSEGGDTMLFPAMALDFDLEGKEAGRALEGPAAVLGSDKSTLFHPASIVQALVDEDEDEAASPSSATVGAPLSNLRRLPGVPPAAAGYFELHPGEGEDATRVVTGPKTDFGHQTGDVCLPDEEMSSPHFRVEVVDGEFFLRDLESRSGTFINGRAIRCVELRSGDEVRAGATTLRFHLGSPSQP